MPFFWRRERIAFSAMPVSRARRESEKPLRLRSSRRSLVSDGRPSRGELALLEHQVLDLREEPGVDLRQFVDALERPARAERIGDVQQAVRPRLRAARRRPGAAASSFNGPVTISLRPSRPVSRPRSAFCSDSWKVRPIAITSPTDFICVVSRSLAARNFSNVKRGILVTT